MEYMVTDYRENDLVRMDILIAGEDAPPLAAIVHKDIAASMGKGMTRKLKELIPRQQFKVSIQAAIGQKIVASSQISPIRKDVLAKCYGGRRAARTHTGAGRLLRCPSFTPWRAAAGSTGGDITRKKKLLNKQAKGKKRMKAIGKVNVPQEAFMAVLNLKDGN